MQSRRWLRYVHWFGYVSSFIIILQLIALSYVGGRQWIRDQSRRDDTRMHSGPAIARLNSKFDDDAKALLGMLPALSTLKPEGVRFVAMPSFGHTHFALSLRKTTAGGEGEMFMIELHGTSVPRRVPIHMEAAKFAKMLAQLDALSASWDGEASWWTDGTGVVFERVQGTQVTSGGGNSPNFYGKIGEIIFKAVRPTIPQLAPFAPDWHPLDFSTPKDNGS